MLEHGRLGVNQTFTKTRVGLLQLHVISLCFLVSETMSRVVLMDFARRPSPVIANAYATGNMLGRHAPARSLQQPVHVPLKRFPIRLGLRPTAS